MKKTIVAVLAAGVALTMAVGLAACTPEETGTYHTVTYKNGDEVLKTERVKDGEKAVSYVPTKDGGYEFVNWFATPSKNHKYDFDQVITKDTTIYAGFTLFKNDTRDFYVVGSGSSELLFISNWGKIITEKHKLTKAATTNEYTITMDLKKGDQFQFAINTDWANKRGFGYLASQNLENGTKAFDGEGSVYDDSAKGSNISCEYSGNYTFKLKTYPNEDYYNTSGNGYTEERKEIYNIGTYDSIEWVRNGDVVNDTITVTDFYIKGASITGWKNMYNPHTQMVNGGNKYTMSIYLKQGEEFMFTSRVSKISDDETEVTDGADFIKSNALTVESRTLIEGYTAAGGNMKAKASGNYTFTYDNSAKTLAVTFDATGTLTAYDYYLDGNFNGGSYGDFIKTPNNFKLVETAAGSGVYEIKGVTLDAGKELLIRSFKPGDKLDYANKQIDFQFAYLAANTAFEVAAKDNNNIKVKTTGNYDISFDSYSQVITITPHNDNAEDTLDIYVKGANINGWSHGFDAQWKMTLSADKTAYEYVLTVEEGKPVELGLEKHPKGETTGYGTFLNSSSLGNAGDANALFTPETAGNLKCSTAGTYKFVYNIETEKVDIYEVTAE